MISLSVGVGTDAQVRPGLRRRRARTKCARMHAGGSAAEQRGRRTPGAWRGAWSTVSAGRGVGGGGAGWEQSGHAPTPDRGDGAGLGAGDGAPTVGRKMPREGQYYCAV